VAAVTQRAQQAPDQSGLSGAELARKMQDEAAQGGGIRRLRKCGAEAQRVVRSGQIKMC
jgi:hypothetical protein